MYIGEAMAGEGPNAAHINIMLGSRKGPVGQAFANSLAAPRMGYIPFMAVLKPNVPTKPPTLFVAKADLRGDLHSHMTWGPAQAGVALGVQEAVASGLLTKKQAREWVSVAAVWVSWEADDADAVFRNNREATREAIRSAMDGGPGKEELKEAMKAPSNPFYTPKLAEQPAAETCGQEEAPAVELPPQPALAEA